ncbi:MAG: ATP-binding cassette domain-containing protein [Coriobacteriales bacterium]|jgi:putative ABC transport system ATP-binding protein|nr:ATP-binding cassette domain-containing protein [Coriobacteriales bacterium]
MAIAFNTQTVVSAEGLGRSFASTTVIADVSLKLNRQSTTALVGPSGSGKSTLLSLLGLLLDKSAGHLELFGSSVESLDAGTRACCRRLGIGFVFQHTQLIGALRAIDNVLVQTHFLHAEDRKVLMTRIEGGVTTLPKRALVLLEAFGLKDRVHHFPHQLSVGQKRRVALARALLLKPPLLIADEPTNDLDAISAQLVCEALFSAAADGHALIFATHDNNLARRADVTVSLGRAI